MINTCSPIKGLLRTVVILYYHQKRQAALLSQIYSHGTDRKENTLNGCTVSSGYSATFFAASKQRNSNSVQGIFMYEKFNSLVKGTVNEIIKTNKFFPYNKLTLNSHLELLGFWTLSIVRYSKEHNVLETRSVSEEYHLLGYDAV
jgi:hypothetical protein